jgi:hypothetical protein
MSASTYYGMRPSVRLAGHANDDKTYCQHSSAAGPGLQAWQRLGTLRPASESAHGARATQNQQRHRSTAHTATAVISGSSSAQPAADRPQHRPEGHQSTSFSSSSRQSTSTPPQIRPVTASPPPPDHQNTSAPSPPQASAAYARRERARSQKSRAAAADQPPQSTNSTRSPLSTVTANLSTNTRAIRQQQQSSQTQSARLRSSPQRP